MAKIRLFLENEQIKKGGKLLLEEKPSHYLINVMKRAKGDTILLFNGRDGEFEAEIITPSKKQVEVEIISQTKKFIASEDVWLLFAPIKKDNTDFVIEKATELGVGHIIPVITKNTISDKTKTERFRAQAIEASEQSRRLDVPKVDDAIKLADLLKTWDAKRTLFYMDETGNGTPVAKAFSGAQMPIAILVGPEGGFAKEELDFLQNLPYTKGVNLGPLILRAETASVAALSCWQAISGNWK